MNTRPLLRALFISLAALAAGLQARAVPITSFTSSYTAQTLPNVTWTFNFGLSENFVPGPATPIGVTLLSVALPSANGIWGTTYTLKADNTPTFAAFTTMVTDSEMDWFARRITSGNLTASSSLTAEPTLLFGSFNNPLVDLQGHNISEITVAFGAWTNSAPPPSNALYGSYTVSFFETVPDTGSAAGLLGSAVITLAAIRRVRRSLAAL